MHVVNNQMTHGTNNIRADNMKYAASATVSGQVLSLHGSALFFDVRHLSSAGDGHAARARARTKRLAPGAAGPHCASINAALLPLKYEVSCDAAGSVSVGRRGR